MICIELFGGLGNQMFQYAFGAVLARNHKTNLILNANKIEALKNKKKVTIRNFELDIFPNILESNATKVEIRNFKPLSLRIINFLKLIFTKKGISNSKYFVERGRFFDKKVCSISNNCYLVGYWQSFKYFNSEEELIRNKFKFPAITDETNLSFLQKIKNVESVSLHIRRGDYLVNDNNKIHSLCSIDYYLNAISFIKKNVIDPVFFIFSDDINWAKDNLDFIDEPIFINVNKGKCSYIDMQLMATCKHNIIANSSFSWWAGWLNENNSKIVIAPANWFSEKNIFVYEDLIPSTWVIF